jgi:hypothetical protein
MRAANEVQPISSDLSDRTLTFNLHLYGPDQILIRSCEVVGTGFRSRFSFQETKNINEVLVGRLAHAITASLKSLPDGAHVLCLPAFLVELPGLVLAGVHVMVIEVSYGFRSAILRFKEFIGAANKAFLMDLGVQEAQTLHSEKLAMNVLEDICMPILNLCHALEDLGRMHGQTVSPQVRERAREFAFHTELLKRFIFNAGIGHANAPEVLPLSEAQLARLTAIQQ